MTWQTKNNVANVVRSARDGGSGFGSRFHPVTILNVYIYWLINLIIIIIIQILMFAQWTVSVVFFSICERRTRNRIKIFASFFLNDYVFERAIHNEPCSVQRGTIFCSAKFIQNTKQILCFTVFCCCCYLVCVWGCCECVRVRSNCKHYDCILFFYMAANGNNGAMKIESKKKSKSRKRKCGQITRDKVNTSRKKKKWITKRSAYIFDDDEDDEF